MTPTFNGLDANALLALAHLVGFSERWLVAPARFGLSSRLRADPPLVSRAARPVVHHEAEPLGLWDRELDG